MHMPPRGWTGRQPFFSPLQHHHTRLNAGPPARLETVLHSFIGLTHYFTADSGLKGLKRWRGEREEQPPPPMFFPIET